MNLPKQVILLFLFILFFAVACNGDDTVPLPTMASPASVDQTVTTNGSVLPATNTPASTTGTSTLNDNNDLETIDEVVERIDSDVCREAHETLTELDGLLAQGQDVADLKTAVVELITELDNCTLETPSAP